MLPTTIKHVLKRPHSLFSDCFFDPWYMMKRWLGMLFFVQNLFRYQQLNRRRTFAFRVREMLFRSYDRFGAAGSVPLHYFQQDLWAAKTLFRRGVREHVDVGSRLDGFIAHVLPFCNVTFVDIRPLAVNVDGLQFRQGSVTKMPFADNSVPSLSCLHVIEHIGLGRYGDPVEPDGYLLAAKELSRILRPKGVLLLGTPIGRERLCFDAHRIFDPQTVVKMFPQLRLVEFLLIDDRDRLIPRPATFDHARSCNYGCGLFAFTKDES